jgi:hypothetical protein
MPNGPSWSWTVRSFRNAHVGSVKTRTTLQGSKNRRVGNGQTGDLLGHFVLIWLGNAQRLLSYLDHGARIRI